MVDTLVSGASAERLVGSSPILGTKYMACDRIFCRLFFLLVYVGASTLLIPSKKTAHQRWLAIYTRIVMWLWGCGDRSYYFFMVSPRHLRFAWRSSPILGTKCMACDRMFCRLLFLLNHLSLRGVAGMGKPDTQCVTPATTSNLPFFCHLTDSQQYKVDFSSPPAPSEWQFQILNSKF